MTLILIFFLYILQGTGVRKEERRSAKERKGTQENYF